MPYKAIGLALLIANSYGILEVDRANQQNGLQQVFESSKQTTTLDLTNHEFTEYSTTISVGNPPQEFKALVDLSWSDAFIPSISCRSSDPTCHGRPLYNASASSSYMSNGTRVHVVGGGFHTWGNISMDAFHIGNLEVSNQSFEEADTVLPDYFFDDRWYDAVLPLARNKIAVHGDSNMSVPSVFQNMVEQRVLAHNVIGFKLPQSKYEHGQVDIGHVNQSYTNTTKDIAHLPIKEVSCPPDIWLDLRIYGGWYVDVVSVTFNTKPDPIIFNLTGYTAVFETIQPFMLLPDSFGRQIDATLGSEGVWGLPCEKVDDLPDLVISMRGQIGEMVDFVFHGPEYAPQEVKVPFTPDGYCNVMVGTNGNLEPREPGFLRLGSWFFRKFYTVFDADGMVVRCEFSPLWSKRLLEPFADVCL